MSIKIMSAVFESEKLGPIERLIMLALADHADDAGRCYPSNARLQSRTGLSERAVRQNVRKLTEAGFLDVHIGVGQGGANIYVVRPQGGHQMPPAPDAPGISFPTPRHIVPLGGAPDAPKPSITINEPSVEYPPCIPPDEKPPPKARLPADWALSDEGWAYARSQGIPEKVIEDEARGFHAYWTDRTDREARKSERGWEQCWAGWCRRIASRYSKGSPLPFGANNQRGQRGGNIASIAARRRAESEL